MKRGGYLARKTPLKRTRMRRQTSRRARRMSAADKLYRAWIHTQPCCGYGKRDWRGKMHLCGFGFDDRLQQSHERDHTGTGLKSRERRSVMKCGSLHRRYEAEHVRAREWMRARIAEANAKFDREHGAAVRPGG